MTSQATCRVIGEIEPVPLNDLVQNAAVEFLKTNPTSKPRWCMKKTEHDVAKCTFLHRTTERAAQYVVIRGEPAPVPIAHLIMNKGLEYLQQNGTEFGEWCGLASPHDIASCKRLHLGDVPNDKTVHIESEEQPVRVSHLLLNRGASYLLSYPDSKGVWCNNKVVHDVINCAYIHRRVDGHPKVVYVEEEKFPIPVNQLISNKALHFLLDNPQCAGRWCGRAMRHDVEECSYLHRKHPFVRVDGESIRINALVSNRGLKYLLEHPEAQGHWCRSKHDGEHPIDTCSFIHQEEHFAAATDAHGVRAGAEAHGRSEGRAGRSSGYTQRRGEVFQYGGRARSDRGPGAGAAPNANPTVSVGGQSVNTVDLVNNRGLQFLQSHPNAEGKWCTRTRDGNHNEEICNFIHRKQP